ncbi:MAG: hypothetical protein KGJ35_00465, partial [Patescibacteria group bacterium]|nr:hypothetical protein [Patescibacteria group bacterium]
MKMIDYAETIKDICNEYATCWGNDVTYGHNDPYKANKYLVSVFEKQAPEMLEKLSASKNPTELFERYYRILSACWDKKYANERSAVIRFISKLVSDLIQNYEDDLTISEIFETLLIQDWATSGHNQGRWNNKLIQRYIDL